MNAEALPEPTSRRAELITDLECLRRIVRDRIPLTIRWAAIVGAAVALGGMAARAWLCIS